VSRASRVVGYFDGGFQWSTTGKADSSRQKKALGMTKSK
jgi:hypothetical protein